ncbi:hypothetical protein M3P36_05245 [Altererythrobacter sp. KTW20L]|uniref:hypothetical protein n=1 Tax=Altererythrobacter sp. KTW20L TaxID=2942210 RepID=UPI0020BDB74F|nr:hypothetical protein [Altererythrobacter sp. KTW20L]MCL6250450.1 hypothetical protein [Altererythrobacter sp. KTW20L]
MLARLSLFLLLCALIVPRTAWDAHLVGHEELAVSGAVHTHHSEHAHEHDDSSGKHALADAQDGDGSLTHDHSPSFALASADVVSNGATADALPLVGRSMHEARSEHFTVVRRPESLLRPPRLA